jgi:hypothetical protein
VQSPTRPVPAVVSGGPPSLEKLPKEVFGTS